MVMTREEVQEIARATAQAVVDSLHRYPIEYQEPANVRQGLTESMGEELTAAYFYRQRARHAIDHLDATTAALYEHIAGEEDQHWRDFSKRLDVIFPRGTPGNYQEALAKIRQDFPYPMYNHHDWNRMLKQRGFRVPEEAEECEEREEEEENGD